MKYMGSKLMMLRNGLGEVLSQEMVHTHRFVDLFAGSGAVAIHVARHFTTPVLAFDLQRYSAVLTNAVVSRQRELQWEAVWDGWRCGAEAYQSTIKVPSLPRLTQAIVSEFRSWCAEQTGFPITKAYGGHYLSPWQAIWIDSLRNQLPAREPARTVALAALIQAASQCIAAPGHTAQPFQPTRTAKHFLAEAWIKDVVSRTKSALEMVAGQFAHRGGQASVADANEAAGQLQEGDLAFVDPPYSSVHYSRFYHVLETIANGTCGEVTGAGRYPAPALRPRSKYSVTSESAEALDDLLDTIASRGANAVFTFPDHKCSNGLAGDSVRKIAARYFRIRERQVQSKFSTLGGTSGERENEGGRSSRRHATELVLVMKPK
ncbi:MAG TPA: DNA adenine methylase [Candidatus Acidoferrum sp.]|nr:DNA adenine methylase [Candidatus Acidoferrum sp.]